MIQERPELFMQDNTVYVLVMRLLPFLASKTGDYIHLRGRGHQHAALQGLRARLLNPDRSVAPDFLTAARSV